VSAQRDERGEQGALVITGTWAGIDPRLVFLETLPAGQYAVSLWCGNVHRFLISEDIVTGVGARMVRHLEQRHAALALEDSLETNVCSAATCPEVGAWAMLAPAAETACSKTASGL
jgi:hypothetical protein